jgi:RNA polymerase sigma factor (sigma-70 family)
MRDRLTRLFLRYRSRHDGRALARLFDLLAPELLGVAVHLLDDPWVAEDLVQETFLVAIQHADRFDSDRSVKPWLYGILVRKAAVAQRSRARTPDPERLINPTAEDPATRAANAEVPAVLEKALERCRPAERDVLRSYLLEGRPLTEIAARLERSPGTVRMQLHRGLERLRRGLPAGIAVGVVARFSNRGLAAMRGRLLEAAGVSAGHSAVLSSVGIGGMMATKHLVAAGIVIASALCIPILVHQLWSPPRTQVATSTIEQGLSAKEGAGIVEFAEDAGSREAVQVASDGAPANWDGSLEIHFRARGEDGSWDAQEDGQANVIWNPTHKWGRWPIPIHGGTGILPAKEEHQADREWLDFHFVRLGGRRARALDQPLAYPKGPELTVDCEYLPSAQLAVYDGPGRVHAAGLVLVEAAEFAEWDHFQVPIHWAGKGPAKTLGSDLTSPITLEDRDGRTTYFVRSQASAWSRVTIDHETPGQRSVHLRPGGRVEFTVLAGTLRPETNLRIYEVSDTPGAVLAAMTMCTLTPDGHGFIDGLGVGTWEVRAELGTASYGNPVLGSQQFAVSVGGTTQVTLTLPDSPTPHEPVLVRGEIVLPDPVASSPCLRGVRFMLNLNADDPWSPEFGKLKTVIRTDMRPDPAHPNKLLWDAGKLTPGPWKAEIGSVDWCDTWNIAPGRENTFTVDLTHLQTLRIQVIDRESREPVPIAVMDFKRRHGAGCHRINTGVLQPDPSDPIGSLTFQAPEGVYDLEFTTRSLEARHSLNLETLIHPNGYLEVQFTDSKPASVALLFRSSGMNVPVPTSWLGKIQFVQQDSQKLSWTRGSWGGTGQGSDATRAEFELDATGPIEIRFPPLDEFLEIPPATVQLVAGEKTELEIELVPVP